MAKVTTTIPTSQPFGGSFGDVSVYTNRYGATIARRKGGPTPEQVKNSPRYAPLRRNSAEFGGASKAASMLGNAMISVKHLNDFNIQSFNTRLIKAIFEMDPGVPGSRSIVFSRGKHLLEGLQLNRQHNFDSVVRTPVTFSINRQQHLAVLQLPPLSPGRNLVSPWPYSFFRFRINLGIIRDMKYVQGYGYKPMLEDVSGYAESLDTEWYQVSNEVIGQEVGLKIEDALFDDTCHLVLSIGIEFGRLAHGKVEPVKHVGCAKLLGMA